MMPAPYYLACDGLLSERFAILGAARRSISSEDYRALIGSNNEEIKLIRCTKGAVYDIIVGL